MTSPRRILPVGAALALALAACGGSDSSDDDTVDTVATSDVETETTELFTESTDTETTAAAPAETAPPTDPPESAPADTAPPDTTPPESGDTVANTGGDVGAPAAGVAVSLVEWAIEAPAQYTAGEVTFTATNNGNFPHEFVVIQGEGYESLPLEEGGAVIEDDLPTGALIGRTARIGGGSSESLTVSLAPGNYVLVCNLGGGATSHAGRGQRLDITVS